jgi:hypothetical protein
MYNAVNGKYMRQVTFCHERYHSVSDLLMQTLCL